MNTLCTLIDMTEYKYTHTNVTLPYPSHVQTVMSCPDFDKGCYFNKNHDSDTVSQLKKLIFKCVLFGKAIYEAFIEH